MEYNSSIFLSKDLAAVSEKHTVYVRNYVKELIFIDL